MNAINDERRVRVLQEVAWQTASLVEVLLESDAMNSAEEGSKLLSLLLRMRELASAAMQALDEDDPDIDAMEIAVLGKVQKPAETEAEASQPAG